MVIVATTPKITVKMPLSWRLRVQLGLRLIWLGATIAGMGYRKERENGLDESEAQAE